MKKVLITGGTSGIGLELLRQYYSEGYKCIVVALEDDYLKRTKIEFETPLKQGTVVFQAIDLSSVGAAELLHNYLSINDNFPNVLINNAGFGTHGEIIHDNIQQNINMIRLHIENLYLITRYCLEDMLSKGSGYIINISSIAAFQPSPLLATYGATKAFIYHFSRALTFELKMLKSPIKCLTVCPTPVRTNFGQGTSMEDTNLFNGWMSQSPKEVAQSIFQSYKKGHTFLIPGKRFHLLSIFTRRLPENWQMALSYYFSKPSR
jgi:short-subunit dehydrogenase